MFECDAASLIEILIFFKWLDWFHYFKYWVACNLVHTFSLHSLIPAKQKSALCISTLRSSCSLLQNLDALHDHLGTIYPGMRAPSFRCTDAEKGNNLILHYYSEREGLQDIVIGIIKTVAQQIHGTEIEMKVCLFCACPLIILPYRFCFVPWIVFSLADSDWLQRWSCGQFLYP